MGLPVGRERTAVYNNSLPPNFTLDAICTSVSVSIKCSPQSVDAAAKCHRSSHESVKIEYLEDGDTRWEELLTEKEADEIASRAVYDECDEAHIAAPRTLSVGTSTVWFRVHRTQFYHLFKHVDVRFVVEFRNSEECTRFLHEDMRNLEDQYISDVDTEVAVVDDIMHALLPIRDDLDAAYKNALRRSLPYSQFVDDLPQSERQLIRHRGSSRGDDRPCYLTLHISFRLFLYDLHIDWSEIDYSPASPLRSDAFRSLNNIHLNFPSPTQYDYHNHDHPPQNSTEPLSFTVEATGIHGLTATNSVAQGNSITIKSEHRNVHVNLAGLPGVSLNINIISGDSFFGAINGGNVGGRNNVNTYRITSPARSRSPQVAFPWPLWPIPLLHEQAVSYAGVGRWVQPRPSRPRP
ncbi:hypothetical protein BDN71DRAFT_458094 [Pleurotus eryngii]|uniref:Uncharacterized protein n=1 Tax=Pleurotus eryngii TaxID=5323 RepID=A0A9P5ZLE1_PLEER|nr:hypothetical protein BDN71DRAFT_458094 [Pleurotus eryngii]